MIKVYERFTGKYVGEYRTMKQCAKVTKVHPTTVGNIVNGRSKNPSCPYIFKREQI